EAMTPIQAIGGAVVLVGLALARQGDRSEKVADALPTDVDDLPVGGQLSCASHTATTSSPGPAG
ncbi:MAG TPA: hypothetical protein VFH65_13540, partial [Mycobacterium sp.]|nr:hypothetical protein [Mycobacterium sp.]